MGPKAPSKASNEYSQLLADFEVLQRWQPDNITLLRSLDSSREYLLREFTFNDRREFDAQLQVLNSRKRQLHGCNHLAQLQRIVTHSEDQFCSTYFKIFALFEWEPRSLDQQINERNLQKRRFQEKELWSIACSCIIGLSQLQKQGLQHQSVSSKAILLSEDGTIKLYDPLCSAAASNYDTLLAKRSSTHLYLSPEQVDYLQAQETSPTYNSYKSDIWTLGMVLLEAGLSHYQDECYRDEWTRIHWETLQFNLNRFHQLYSGQLGALLDLMLSREEAVRPDWIQLENRLLRSDESQRQSRASHGTNHDKQRIYQQIIYSEPRSSSVNVQHPPPKPQVLSPPLPPVTYAQSQVGANNGVLSVKPSSIEQSRPLRSLFPAPFYTSSTKIDENLIFIPDQYSQVSDTPNREDSYFNSLTKGKESSVRQLKNKQASAKAFTPYVPVSAQNSNTNEDVTYIVQKYRQGSEYRGQKWRGLRHGQGVFLYLDGGKYEGQWSFNKMQGRGKLYYQSGKLAYEGDWVDDQFSGKGVLYNEYPVTLKSPYAFKSLDEVEEYWLRYEGQFRADRKHGKGILYFTNGQQFQGAFVDDIAEGVGVFTTQDGRRISGRWSANKFID